MLYIRPIVINSLSNSLLTSVKLFTDGRSLFYEYDINAS